MISDPSEGRTVGHFRIVRGLGSGSMGAVFLAEDTNSGEMIALKEISPALLRVPGARERFKNEVSALFRVHHPNIIRAIEYIDMQEYQALAMEYLEGQTLADYMQSTRFSESEVVALLLQLAQGLAAVHAQGVIHRDLKPENIFVSNEGELKIGDFGVAGLGGTSTLTQQGRLVGTAKYFAPEYIETGECDARGDIYALGVLGYELLTGHSPFKATRLQEMMAERFKTTIAQDLAVLAPKVSVEIRGIIAKAMNVALISRYQSAEEVITDLKKLERVEHKVSSSAAFEVPKDEKKSFAVAGIAIVLIVAAIVAVLVLKS